MQKMEILVTCLENQDVMKENYGTLEKWLLYAILEI